MSRLRLLSSCAAAVTVVIAGAAAQAAPPQMTRAEILCRANSGVGFSYYWGGACWCADGCSAGNCPKGSCSGNCPSCNHSGTYGADCSGFVTKVWQVPNPISVSTCGHGGYVASTYTNSTSYWNVISRSNIEGGDSMATSHHVLLYDHGDPWGQMVAYEARGCSYGIVRNWRSCSSDYVAARRINLGSSCQCSPGQSESDACGNCGTRSRTCGSSCQWGAWTSCHDQGPCAPGTEESRDCCDCGSQRRSCGAGCEWGAWTACAGQDPDGGQATCDTGEPGPCASGRVRCVQGCTTCARDYEPVPELCDTIDNDCSGETDEGDPDEMGAIRPAFAARLHDVSHPSTLAPGASGTAWATFLNEGTETWLAGQIWLGSTIALEGNRSPFYDEDTWPAYDVAAVLEHDVSPGEAALFSFTILARSDADGSLADTFRLSDPTGAIMLCPAPEVDVQVRTSLRAERLPRASDAPPSIDDSTTEGCACRTAPSRTSPLGWLAALGLAWLARRRPRRE